MPAVSVIIPCYNQERYISECLDSLNMQTFKDFEAIIIDDGSTDNSAQIVRLDTDKYPNFSMISQQNKGVVSARNFSIAHAKGEYIFPLDADDIIAPTALEKLVAAIKAGKGDIITSRVEMFGKKTGELKLKYPNKYNLSKNNCLVNSSLFRKADFEKSGGYDSEFNLGLEDYDLWLNMVLNQKLKIYRIPEILFFYRIKNITESRNLQQIQLHNNILLKKLKRKYPQMFFYRIFRKITKYFTD